jgi:hypothetical protein
MPTTTNRQDTSRRKNRTSAPRTARSRKAKVRHDAAPSVLNTDAEVQAYLAEHLTPCRFSPKGQPIYRIEEIEKLNAIFYPDA